MNSVVPLPVTPTSITCLTLMKLFCVKWPTVWRRSTLFVYALAGWHRGLMPTVVLLVGAAAVWSVATDGLSTQNIDVYGSTPSARGSGCTGPRKNHTGSVVWSKTDAHFPNYGVHCHLCWAVIVTPPGLLDTLRMVLRSFSPGRLTT